MFGGVRASEFRGHPAVVEERTETDQIRMRVE
jgi:hypothetical protein